MGRLEGDVSRSVAFEPNDIAAFTTRAESLVAWAQQYSLAVYPFSSACCGMEFMSALGPRYDMSRFFVDVPQYSPRKSDLLWVVGSISQRQAPVLRRIYEQMAAPKWVIACGACAATGGFYENYATVPGIDKLIPCDVYIPGCPPRPEAILDGLMLLMDKIAKGDRKPAIARPRLCPKTNPELGLVSLGRIARP
jgi:NADH-quinone oxidoreductase subunit B